MESNQISYQLKKPDGEYNTFEMHDGFFTPLWENSHNPQFIVFLYSLTWNILHTRYIGINPNLLHQDLIPFFVEDVAQHILRAELEEYFNECLKAEDDCIVENKSIVESE